MADDEELGAPASLFERAGGEATFVSLVEAFYEGVETDPVLRPLYPDDDLAGARERLSSFLVQLAGGPRRYEALRGEPRLRQRHLEFPISGREAAAWMTQMDRAVEAAIDSAEVAATLRDYFRKTAAFLVNKGGLSIGRPAG